jgi:hypothetical protein
MLKYLKNLLRGYLDFICNEHLKKIKCFKQISNMTQIKLKT